MISIDDLLKMSLKLIENRIEYQSRHPVSNVIYKCLDLLLEPLLKEALVAVESLNDIHVSILEKITITIMRNLSSNEQAYVFRKFYQRTAQDSSDRYVIFPLVAIIGNARPQLGEELDFNQIMHNLLGSHIASSAQKPYLWKCISSIINKFKLGNIYRYKFL